MNTEVHQIWNMTSANMDRILIWQQTPPDLCWPHSLDLTPHEAVDQLRSIHLHHVTIGHKVYISSCHNYVSNGKNTIQSLDLMDDVAVALALLSH
jgi:hypothetical protein